MTRCANERPGFGRFSPSMYALVHRSLSAAMMMRAYSRIFDKLKERGWNRIGEKVALSKAEKIWVAVRYGAF